jgi:type I restriction enzyme S subunit
MDNWKEKKSLEELVKSNFIKLDRGRVISSIDLVTKIGEYPVYSSSAQNNGHFGSYGLYDFDEELITWSVDGGGYFFYRPKHKFSVTNVSGILRILNTEKINYKFIYYLFCFQHTNQIFDYVDKAHPSVIKKRYFIPTIDIAEQQSIANILSKTDLAIAKTEALIAKYTKIKTGLMQDLLTEGIDVNGNIRSEQTHEFKDSQLGRIPKEWECIQLKYLCDEIIDCPHSTPNYTNQGVLVARTQNIKDGKYLIESSSYLSKKDYKERVLRLEPQAGDIIFTREAPIGEAFVIPLGMKICLGQRVMLFRPNKLKLNPDFLVELIYSNKVKMMFDNIVGGTTVSHLNVKEVKDFYFTIPLVEEQIQIVNYLSKNRNYIECLVAQLSKLQSLKKGLMQDLLTGKVRVKI